MKLALVVALALVSADAVGARQAPVDAVQAPIPPAPPVVPALQAPTPQDLPPPTPRRPVRRVARAQPVEPLPPESAVPPVREVEEPHRGHRDQVVRVGSDYVLGSADTVDELVVVMGNATLDGHVMGDVAVVLGQARLGPTAVVEGEIVVVGGSLAVASGAEARRGVVVVGGSLDAPAGFMPGGEQVVIGFTALGDGVRGALPWMMHGLLWARPIVPSLPWVWGVVGVCFLVYLGVLLVFERPVRVTSDALTATPLRALVTGLAIVVLAGPLLLLLAATLVGLLAVPFVLCALIVAGLVGKIGAVRWLGSRVVPEGDDNGRFVLLRSFVVGCVLLVLTYMVPVVGGVTWATMGAAGLGAAALAFVSAYRQENPVPAPPVVVPLLSGDGPNPPELAAPAEGQPAAVQSLARLPRARFTDRAAALVLDVILVAVTIGLLPSLRGEDVFVPLLLVYRFVLWVWKGVTVGGIICQLRIVRLDGTPMSGGEALVRTFGSIFSFVVLGIGFAWALRDPDGQTWHDKMAGTVVVKVPRNWPV